MPLKLRIGGNKPVDEKDVTVANTTINPENEGLTVANTTVIKEKKKLDNSNIIRNITTDQSEILWNIMQLYNGGEPFEVDITASELKFYGKRGGYKYDIPVPSILMDVFPTSENIIKITPFKPLPLDNESVGSVVTDLPFVCSPKTCKSVVEKKEGANMISNRFSSWYPMEEGIANIFYWLGECSRVIKENGIIVWKMQDSVSGGRQWLLSEFSVLCADYFGLYTIDHFVLQAKARLVSASKIKKQQHSRKFTSDFWVFQKNRKKSSKVSLLNLLEYCKKEVHEGMVWELK